MSIATPASPLSVLSAGSATADLTPQGSVFLSGYPKVSRYSEGVHDPLTTTALVLKQDGETVVFVANDLLFVGRGLVREVRRRVRQRTGIPENCVLMSATHTHSGPVMVNYVSNSYDSVIPKADDAYLDFVAERVTEAVCEAARNAVPAELGLAVAHAGGVGTNRHDPAGPADPEVPMMVVRSKVSRKPIACMLVYAMHPTVLHEDSKLISADFPHFTRQYLRTCGALPEDCAILYHNGAAGNQSPRHVTRANTFAEAQRLGELLGANIASVIPSITYIDTAPIEQRSASVAMEMREIPPLETAIADAANARARLEQLRAEGAPRTAVRSAECDWFGADKSVVLARAKGDGRIAPALAGSTPAELHVVSIGPWKFVTWPGEFFVEYALAVKTRSPRTHVITLANGELQGYIVTPDAVTKATYEATNALFSAANGGRMVRETLALLGADA